MRRRVEKAVLALLVLVVVGYCVSEVRLRLIYYAPIDAPFPFVHRPLVFRKVVVSRDIPGLKAQVTRWSTNSRGLRGDEVDLHGDDDVFKVLTLGGSVTECLLVDDGDAWPRVAQDVLSRHVSRKVWVGNAGMSGQNTPDYIVHMKTLVPHVAPDVVIVMPGGNDLQAAVEDRLLPMDFDTPGVLALFQKELYHPEYAGFFATLEPSYTFSSLSLPVELPPQSVADFYVGKKAQRYAAPKLDEIPDWEDFLEVYRQNLETLIASAAALPKTRLVLMTHPFLWKENMSEAEERALWAGYSCLSCPDPVYYGPLALRRALRDFNRITLQACAEHHLSCFDLEAKLEKTLRNFYDDAHLKKAGSREVGRLVGEFMAEEGVVQ